MTTFNRKFEAYQGADISIDFTIYDADGVTATNITGWALAANFARVSTGDTDEDLIKTTTSGITLTDAANGEGSIVIAAAVSQEMDAGDWDFDLWRTTSGSTYPLAVGSFTLAATPRSRSTDT